MFEVAQGAAALGAGKRCAFRDVDGELDLAVGGVDALAARARRLRKPLRQVGGDDDQTPRDPGPGAMVRSFIPPSLVRVVSGSDPPCEIRVVYDHSVTVDLQLDVDSPCSAFVSDSFSIDGAVVLV